MNNGFVPDIVVALLLTVAFETVFFLLAGKRSKKDFLLLVLVNMITNPAVNLLYRLGISFTDWNAALIVLPLELSAIGIEGYYYRKYGCDFRRPYLFSAGANVFSYGLGLFLQTIDRMLTLGVS